MRSAFWHFSLLACSAAVWVLIPVSLATVWLARKARDGECRADIELLRMHVQRLQQIKTRTQR